MDDRTREGIQVKHLGIGIAALLVLLTSSGVAYAAPAGTLDKSFSGDGIVNSALLSNSTPAQVQVDPQNRVIVSGYNASKNAYVVLRYKANGVLDPSWKPYYLNSGYGRVTSIVIDGTRTLLSATGNGSIKAGYLIRLNADGRLDKTFGNQGVAAHRGCWRCGLSDVGISASGDIFATSTAGGYGESYSRGEFVKVSPDGLSQNSWDCPPDPSDECGTTTALTVSPSYVYVAGQGVDDDYVAGAVVGRYLLSGARDTSYGVDGFAWLSNGSDHDLEAIDVAVSPGTGKATVLGTDCTHYPDYSCHSFVARFTAAGFPDPTFEGQVNFGDGVGSSVPFALAMQSGNVVVVGADTNCNNTATTCFGIERLTDTGALDTTFNGTGFVHTAKAPAEATGVRIFSAKMIVAGGQYVARYQG